MKSIEGFERRLEYLTNGHAHRGDGAMAWVASLSPEELDRMSEIFIRHSLVDDLPFENLTPDEIAFLQPLFEREVEAVPIDRTKPVCQCCGCQPAIERGEVGEGVFWCDRCWQQTCPSGVDERLRRMHPGIGLSEGS